MTIENFTTKETRFLSNFYPYKNPRGHKYPYSADVVYDGIKFECVECAYQAAKLMNKSDRLQFAKMTPFEAKSYMDEQKEKGYPDVQIRPDWEQVKVEIMTDLIRQKFDRHKNFHMHHMLLQTGSQDLIEGNDWGDTFWGVDQGIGENHLGKILMQVRAEIRQSRENIERKPMVNLIPRQRDNSNG